MDFQNMDSQRSSVSMDTLDNNSYLENGSALTREQFDHKYGRIEESHLTLRKTIQQYCSKRKCSGECCNEILTQELPVINAIRNYKIKKYLLGDIFSAVSLGVVNIPGAMAYALLANVAPVYGLYTAMFPPLIYFLFSTSHHVSLGVMALSSLLVADVINRETFQLQETLSQAGENATDEMTQQFLQESFELTILLSFWCGVISVIMGFLKLGFITSYLGDSFLAGFLASTNVVVITTQVKSALQIKIHPHIGPLSFIFTIIDICRNIKQVNIASLTISIVALIVIIVVKYAVNERFKSQMKVPIPIDFIAVVIATIACYFGEFQTHYGVRLIGNVPRGLPPPSLPPLHRSGDVLIDSFVLALIGYILVFIMAKLFSEKYRYSIDSSQEFKAVGWSNIFGSFFSCIPASSSPPRCFLVDQTGGKSQLANALAALLIMLITSFGGALLEPMPVCILNVMVICACIPIFVYYKMPLIYWKTNKYDFLIFAVTFCSVLFLTVNLGLVVGVSFSILTVLFRTQRGYNSVKMPLPDRDGFVHSKHYSKGLRIPGVIIFYFASPVYFASIPNFKENLFKATVNPFAAQPLDKEVEAEKDTAQVSVKLNGHEEIQEDSNLNTPLTTRKQNKEDTPNTSPIKHIIIDASGIAFIDTSAAKMLGLLYNAYQVMDISMYIVECNHDVEKQLECVTECKEILEKATFSSLYEAIQNIKQIP